MNPPKHVILVSDTGESPPLFLTRVEPVPELLLRTPEFRPGRSPLCPRPLVPARPPNAPSASARPRFVPLRSSHDYAFWAAGKIRLYLALPHPRRLEKCLPLVVCYDHCRWNPPEPDEIDRVIETLQPGIPREEAHAFRLQAAILRAAAREYFSGW